MHHPEATTIGPANDQGPSAVLRRVRLLQELDADLPWFTFVIYRRGHRQPFTVDFGRGHLSLTLAQVDAFVVGVRAADAHHTDDQRASLAAITALHPRTATAAPLEHR